MSRVLTRLPQPTQPTTLNLGGRRQVIINICFKMSQPMLDIRKGPSVSQTVPHLLPCRVQYDGPAEPLQTYWGPSEAKGEQPRPHIRGRTAKSNILDGSKVAYFRGRKLHGKTVKLPEGHRGVVLQKGDVKAAAVQAPEAETVVEPEEHEGEDPTPAGCLETRAEFEEIIVWGHEATADATSDPYVRSMEEWLALADQVASALVRSSRGLTQYLSWALTNVVW